MTCHIQTHMYSISIEVLPTKTFQGLLFVSGGALFHVEHDTGVASENMKNMTRGWDTHVNI